MKKRAEIKSGEILVIGIISLVLCLAFVFADSITTSTGATSFTSVNEDAGYWYNITINNTGEISSNITQVNITLPGSFSYINDTNGTSGNSSYLAFTSKFNASSPISFGWYNSTNGIIGGGQNFSFWFNATASTPGTYGINVTYIINGTNKNSINLTITINDITRPTVTVGFPTNKFNYTIAGIFNTSINVSDNVGVTGCFFNLNNGANTTMIAFNASTGFNYTSSLMADGNYTSKYYCNDAAGNVNGTSNVSFTIDTIAPNVAVDYPIANSSHNRSSISINLTVVDATTRVGENGCNLTLTNGTTSRSFNMTNQTAFVFYKTVDTAVEMNYIARIYCNDTFSHVNNTRTITFEIDNTVPNITINTPIVNNAYSNDQVLFNFTLNGDDGYCWYSINGGVTNVTMTASSSANTEWTNTYSPYVPDGGYTANVYCNDTAGNRNYTKSVAFSVETRQESSSRSSSSSGGAASTKVSFAKPSTPSVPTTTGTEDVGSETTGTGAEGQETGTLPVEAPSKTWLWILVGVVLVILVVGVIYWMKKR